MSYLDPVRSRSDLTPDDSTAFCLAVRRLGADLAVDTFNIGSQITLGPLEWTSQVL